MGDGAGPLWGQYSWPQNSEQGVGAGPPEDTHGGRGEQFLEGPADMGQEQLAVDTNWPGIRGALGPRVHQRAV